MVKPHRPGRPPPCRSWEGLAERYGDALAVLDPHHTAAEQYSYSQLAATIRQFAAGLQSLGLRWAFAALAKRLACTHG